MLKDVVILSLAAYGFIVAVEITPAPGKLLSWIKKHKPFSCPLCLAFWFCFLFLWLYYKFPFWHSVFFAFAGAGGAVMLKNIEIKMLPPVNFPFEEDKQ